VPSLVCRHTGFYGLARKSQYRIVLRFAGWADVDIGRLDSFQTKLTDEQKKKLASMRPKGWTNGRSYC
jgi:hypothetical protein